MCAFSFALLTLVPFAVIDTFKTIYFFLCDTLTQPGNVAAGFWFLFFSFSLPITGDGYHEAGISASSLRQQQVGIGSVDPMIVPV